MEPAGFLTAPRKNTEVWKRFLRWENIDSCQPEPQAEALALKKTKMTTQGPVTAAPGSGLWNFNGCTPRCCPEPRGRDGQDGLRQLQLLCPGCEGPHSPMPGILFGRSRALLWCWQPGISLPRVVGCPGNGAWINRNSHTRAVPGVTTDIKRVQAPPLEHTKK